MVWLGNPAVTKAGLEAFAKSEIAGDFATRAIAEQNP
jgi:hypothetical protein